MFHNGLRTRSAPNCGTAPQGKGREGKRNGREGNATAILLVVESEKSAIKVKFPTREGIDLDAR